jgi:DNA repair exonuclease SbcCD nuclease subunit
VPTPDPPTPSPPAPSGPAAPSNRPAITLLHSADWQIGKPYGRVSDPDKRARLRQVRLDCIQRLAGLCRSRTVDLVLVAGDLFDAPTPSSSDVSAVCAGLGAMGVPVLVIPGNHDHGGPGSVWHSSFFAEERQRRCPNLQVLLERRPLELEQAVVLPCPLLRRRESSDPCAWLQQVNWSELPADKPRLVLAHGAVQGFAGSDLELASDADDDNPPSAHNLLQIQAPWSREIDYVALGDWHGLKQVTDQCWYSGTPEPDRFPRSSTYVSGRVLEVVAARGLPPQVTPLATGQLGWHPLTANLRGSTDLDHLEQQLQALLGDRVGEDLLLLELEGSLSLADQRRLDALRERLEAQLLRLKWRGHCQEAPCDTELAELTSRGDAPLVAAVARSLQQQRASSPADSTLVERALCELHRAVHQASQTAPQTSA